MNCGGDIIPKAQIIRAYFLDNGRGRGLSLTSYLQPLTPTHGYDAGNTQYNTLNYTSDGVLTLRFYKI